MGIGRQNRDLHMFNILAVENRINTFHLPDDKPVATVETLQLSQLLPSAEDNTLLRKNWHILVAHILARYLPQLAFMATHVPKEVEHKYMREMRQKTTIVSTHALCDFIQGLPNSDFIQIVKCNSLQSI